MTPFEYREILAEIDEQPKWRETADKESEYADGNQLDSDLLKKQAELGIPPAVEDLISPALLAIQGYESTTRTDWRVTPDGDHGGKDVADALKYRLNKAERASGADRAMSAAFRGQITCGIGWVEVSRDPDPMRFPYRVAPVGRNEIHWDMTQADPKEWRWLRRQRWVHAGRAASFFPDFADLFRNGAAGGEVFYDGGGSTGLSSSWGDGARQFTTMERRQFYGQREVCIAELWYRQWESAILLKSPDGRVVEMDEGNPRHRAAIALGETVPVRAAVGRVRQSYWCGETLLYDGETPYRHGFFPYVLFSGFTEDMTGVPYGYVRGMKYQQDLVNATTAKLRWGISAVRTVRTKGAVSMSDGQFRQMIGRKDADIVLNVDHMALPGARFEVDRDYQLTPQHFQLLSDARAAIERTSGITSAFMGRNGTATSGVQESTQVEKSNQSIGMMMDNFRDARRQVGEVLLSMLIQDMGTGEETVIVEGDAVRPDRTIVLNRPERDPENGIIYRSNDIQRIRLKVSLEEVPSTTSYRAQQLNALSEAVKMLPPEYLKATVPFLTSLMDVPFRDDLIEAFRAVDQRETPEQVETRIRQAVQDALAKAGNDLKAREIDLKAKKAESEIRALDAKAVQIGVQAAFSAMQGASQVAQIPQIAPIADEIMKGAGYRSPTPEGDDPDFPVPIDAAPRPAQTQIRANIDLPPDVEIPGVRRNTSPAFPPVPLRGETGMQGIETPDAADNLPGQAAFVPSRRASDKNPRNISGSTS